MLRILIADDHEIVRRGVRAQLSQHEDWTVCGEACNGREAVKLAHQLQPRIVVMDLSMPELNGLEATRQIRRSLHQTAILVLSMHASDRMIREAFAAGATGYVLKQESGRHLTKAVESLALNRPYVSDSAPQILPDDCFKRRATKDGDRGGIALTNREREILQLLAEGKNNEEIASNLCISTTTVKTHRSTVMRKLDVSSIVGIVHYAIRNHFVEL